MQVSAVNVSLTAGESARIAISTSWSMPNDRVLGQRPVRPVMCARPALAGASGAAAGGQTVASR